MELQSAWDRLVSAGQETKDELAGRIGGWYATILLNTGRSDEAVEWSSRALRVVPSNLAETTFARFIYLAGLASRGDTEEVLSAVSALPLL